LDYNKAIECDSKNAEYYLERAKCNAELKFTSLAMSDVNKGIEIDPLLADLYSEKASIYYYKEMFEEALVEINKAIDLDATKARFFGSRGALHSMQKNREKAIADYNKAIELDPTDFFPHVNLSKEKYLLEDMNGSCVCLKNAHALLVKNNPNDPIKMEIDEARVDYCDSLKPSYYYQRGIALFNKHEYMKALEVYTTGLKTFPDNRLMLNFRGNTYFALNEFEKAIGDYKKSTENRENLKSDLANRRKTIDLGSEEVVVNSFIAGANLSMAESYFALLKYDEALLEINKGILIAPEIKELRNEMYYNVRGSILLAQNKPEESLKDFEKCIRINPNFSIAFVNRALARLSFEKLIIVHLKAIKGGVDDKVFHTEWTLAFLGKIKSTEIVELALADCRKAIELDEKNDLAYYTSYQLKKAINLDYCSDIKLADQLRYNVLMEDLIRCK
jgi:tetratricopeptide (TPR) repeat protein